MKISTLLLAAATFVLASCIEIKSTVIVSKDGTATIEETVLLSAQLAGMLQGDQGGQLKGLVMDKEKAEERAKKLGEGVTVKSHEEVKTPDGKSGMKVVFAVADVTKLKYAPYEPEQEGKPSTTQPMTFALSGSTLTITNPDADKKKGGDAEKPKKNPQEIAMMKSQMAMMKPMFAGMHVAVAVKGANGISSSNAAHLTDGTISYMDIQFDKIMDNADVFTGFMESADTGLSPEEVAEKFKNVDGLKIEGKKVVTAELK